MNALEANPSPRALGYRMPPERAPHAATWAGWPSDDAHWEGWLEPVREEVARFLATLARYEPVRLLARDEESERDARERLDRAGAPAGQVRIVRAPLNDVWLRDSGPLFLVGRGGRLAASDWRFDGWGGKYPAEQDDQVPARIAEALGVPRFRFDTVLEGGAIEVGADGTVLTTKSCLLDGIRNPGVDGDELAERMREGLGVNRTVWLQGGLVDDHTDGHVDTVARWLGPNAVACCLPDHDDTDNLETLTANRERLMSLRRADGEPMRVVTLPLPRDRSEVLGVRPPRSYANFVWANGALIVPTYSDPRDAEALAILRQEVPDREVIGLPAAAIVSGGGAFHCLTQHQPEGAIPS